MGFVEKIYWISPVILFAMIGGILVITHKFLPKLEKEPFPWCCPETMSQDECAKTTKPLERNIQTVRDLQLWSTLALLFSIIIFVTFVVKSISKVYTSAKFNSWMTFIYHFMLFVYGGYLSSMTTFAHFSFNDALEDIRKYCLISVSKTKDNIWTEWDVTKMSFYYLLYLFAIACVIELLCHQFEMNEQYNKGLKMGYKKNDVEDAHDKNARQKTIDTESNV